MADRWDEDGRRLVGPAADTGRGGEYWKTLPRRLNAIFDWFQDIGLLLTDRVKNSLEVDEDQVQLVNDLPDSSLVPDLVYGTDEDGVRGWKADLGGTIAGQPVTAPTAADDGCAPVWDEAAQRYVHAAVSGRTLKTFLCRLSLYGSGEYAGNVHVQLQVSKSANFAVLEYELDTAVSQTGWRMFSGETWDAVTSDGVPSTFDAAAYTALAVADSDVRYIRWRMVAGEEEGDWIGEVA